VYRKTVIKSKLKWHDWAFTVLTKFIFKVGLTKVNWVKRYGN